MKLAISGKGGVGKTTITALLARAFAEAGRRVLAIDADPNATLASSLGFPDPETVRPLTEMDDLIEERTGARPGASGSVFRINPRVDDIPERFAVEHDGIRILRMGAIKSGGSGCYCPENAFLKTLVSHLLLRDQDVLIMDMEAGVEHLGRGTAAAVDWLLTVVQPSRQSVTTARRIQDLAKDIGLERMGVIGNKSRDAGEVEFLTHNVGALNLLGILPFDDGLRRSEQEGRAPEPDSPDTVHAVKDIIRSLQSTPAC